MESRITHTHNHQTYTLQPIYLTPQRIDFQQLRPFLHQSALIFSSCGPFYSLPQPHPTPLQVITTREREGCLKGHRAKQNGRVRYTNSVTYECAIALKYFISFVHCLAASTVTTLLPKVIFTPSVEPNLCLPRARPHLLSPKSPFWPYGTHPFFPHAQTSSILSDPHYLCGSDPFLFQLSYAPLRLSSHIIISKKL